MKNGLKINRKMTRQEYEQKKRECWEEYWRTHKTYLHGDSAEIVLYETFTDTFDRAFALGKQFGNSEQVDVEKAAERYADEIRIPASIPGVMVPLLHDIAKSSYLQGAQDFLGKQETKQETVIQGWVCRDKEWDKVLFASDLYLSMEYPTREEWAGTWRGMGAYIPLDTELFPDLTWESDPEPIEIIIKRKKNEQGS